MFRLRSTWSFICIQLHTRAHSHAHGGLGCHRNSGFRGDGNRAVDGISHIPDGQPALGLQTQTQTRCQITNISTQTQVFLFVFFHFNSLRSFLKAKSQINKKDRDACNNSPTCRIHNHTKQRRPQEPVRNQGHQIE